MKRGSKFNSGSKLKRKARRIASGKRRDDVAQGLAKLRSGVRGTKSTRVTARKGKLGGRTITARKRVTAGRRAVRARKSA
jgi:hypothetical protein